MTHHPKYEKAHWATRQGLTCCHCVHLQCVKWQGEGPRAADQHVAALHPTAAEVVAGLDERLIIGRGAHE